MKRIFFLFGLMAISIAGFSQTQEGYTLGTTSGNVDCYYSITNCNGKTVVLLRFDNKNTSPVTVAWKEIFTTKQLPKSMPGHLNKQVTLAPGVSSVLNCEDMSHREYIIGEADVNQTYRADITGFRFGEVSVKPTN